MKKKNREKHEQRKHIDNKYGFTQKLRLSKKIYMMEHTNIVQY